MVRLDPAHSGTAVRNFVERMRFDWRWKQLQLEHHGIGSLRVDCGQIEKAFLRLDAAVAEQEEGGSGSVGQVCETSELASTHQQRTGKGAYQT